MVKKAILCILDGFGFGKPDKFNAFEHARTPNFDEIIEKFPVSSLKSSGNAVGLPEGQMGNSEVGHIAIGSGRIVKQTLPTINDLIESDSLLNSDVINQIKKLKTIHIVGMISNGGVHSHSDHILYLIKKIHLIKSDLQIKLHIITDGRDVAPNNALSFFSEFINQIKDFNNLTIATLSGRFYAMDRDNRHERTQSYYDLLQFGKGSSNFATNNKEYERSIKQILQTNYDNNIFDEHIDCHLIDIDYKGIINEDGVFFANFRADRMKQLCQYFIDKNSTKNLIITMVDYYNGQDGYKDKFINIIPNYYCNNTLADVFENNDLSQLRVAETEKYAHITFFLNGGVTKKYNNYKEIMIQSKKVRSYDEVPEMSAYDVLNTVKDGIDRKYDLIAVNFANCDMVGHTGNFEASVRAVEVIDDVIGQLKNKALEEDYLLFITADHGNIEEMFDYKNNLPHTQHTTTDVPFIFISKDSDKFKLKDGGICDIAPTVLSSVGLNIPTEMSGCNLIEK